MMNLIALVMAVSAGIVASVPAAHAAALYNSPTWAQMERAIAAAEGREYVETKAVRRDPTFDQMERLIRAIPGAGGGGCDTNAVDALANSAVVTNALTVATTNRVAALEAEQAGAVPLVEDKNGNKTAVTIGSRDSDKPVGPNSLANGIYTTASGDSSHAEGDSTTASGYASHAEGYFTTASGDYSHASGAYSKTRESDGFAFAWNGDDTKSSESPYNSHGPGTFNINPLGGLNGFYIGEDTLSAILLSSVTNNISAENPTFSSAVLAVNLDFTTNTTGAAYVAVTNALAGFGFDAEALAELPGGKVYGSIGALLAALAAAIAWLKKNKVQTLKLGDDSIKAAADGGVAKLDDFFTGSNSLLTGRVNTLIDAKVGDVNAVLAAALAGTEVA